MPLLCDWVFTKDAKSVRNLDTNTAPRALTRGEHMASLFDGLGIRRRFVILLGIFVLGFAVFGFWSFKTLGELQINGPLSQRIDKKKDVVSDILPPPIYIIESYLTALQISTAPDAASRDKLTTTLQRLRAEYQAAHAKWQSSDIDAELQEVLMRQADEPAQAFYTQVLDGMVPALQKQNVAAAQAALHSAEKAYVQHREAIDNAVRLANGLIARDKTDAERRIRMASGLLAAILVGSMAASLGVALMIASSIMRPLQDAVHAAQTFASGDLTARIEVRGKHELAQLLLAMADMQTRLSELVETVRSGAESVDLAASEISTGNTDLSKRTEDQASALQTTAASMDELSNQVRHNADSAQAANRLATQASTVAVEGGGVVNHVVQTMKEIQQESQRIAEITGVIDGIAFQTNILALNAAVEAARAGEQGKGFAVVASEVRALAGRSAAAAKEIKTLINASVDRVQRGAALVDQAGATMQEVVQSVQQVSAIVNEISAASSVQSTGVSQVGEVVTQMDQTTQQNAALVEQMAAAAISLSRQASELVTSVSVFRLPPKLEGTPALRA